MLLKRDVLKSSMIVASQRPSPDLSIEQYLMTPESLTNQIMRLRNIFNDKKIIQIGDDDHLSVLFATYLKSNPVVLEYDSRIRKSLQKSFKQFGVKNYSIDIYDVREPISSTLKADVFYVNPPYSSKNGGKGAMVWIGRASKAVPVGSTSVLVYPIDEKLPWTLSNLKEILDYAYECGLVVTNIDRDLHTYEHLPKDPGLLSSNIYLYKFKDNQAPEIKGINDESLYR